MSLRSSPPDSSKDESPKSPSTHGGAGQKAQPQAAPQFKNRIQSWLRDAEEDAEKADAYLDKKRDLKRESKRDIVDKTDVIKTMEAIEKVRFARCCYRVLPNRPLNINMMSDRNHSSNKFFFNSCHLSN